MSWPYSSPLSSKRKNNQNRSRCGVPFFWTNSRMARLLDWLEKHPLESKIIYRKKTYWARTPHNSQHDDQEGNSLTKVECYDRATRAVFAVDEDIKVRRRLHSEEDFMRLCRRVRDELYRLSFFLLIANRLFCGTQCKSIGGRKSTK